MRAPFTIQHEKYIIIFGVIIKIDGSTQKISPVIQIPRDPFHLKENARTDANIENRKRKGLKFCNFAAILNNSDNAGVVRNPSNSIARRSGPKADSARSTVQSFLHVELLELSAGLQF